MQLFVGLMSGTSMDGVDAVLVDFAKGAQLLAHHSEAISPELTTRVRQLAIPQADNSLDQLGEADTALGQLFARAVEHLLDKAGVTAEQVKAIGSHGQTVRHRPLIEYPFTLQIADPNIIAARTGITTVADFRRKDVALGGQGAPLVPAFHHAFMHDSKTARVILNIGGIANVTLLPADGGTNVTGFDTGPGNCLMDAWMREHNKKNYDAGGKWATSGTVIEPLLKALLADPFFAKAAPKSTGIEYFNLNWLAPHLADKNYAAEDVQRTLLALTAHSIINTIAQAGCSKHPIYVCGGGVHNLLLMHTLQELHTADVASTAILGIDPDWVEAIAFAWFAKNTLEHKPSNLPAVTGAARAAILGGVYYA
ncbi:MAG: anhydro-N-acetylmuramic acid kinase [Gammaproteobacteria bacterium]|nr:anhydro-N-acetylmuramic acid kinase [Gammaproteobacteria bacterium]